MLEIDGNMKSIADAFDTHDSSILSIEQQLETKAPINRPTFTGSLTLPTVGTTTRPLNPTPGTIVYDRDLNQIVVYNGESWIDVATTVNLGTYVKRTGDIMTGRLTGTSSEWSANVRALPPEAEPGSSLDIVATVGWVEDKAREIVEQRLGGSSGSGTGGDDGITINGGDFTINRGDVTIHQGDLTVVNGKLYGDIDLGVL